MARQPVQVHIYLYRKAGDSYEYAVFGRADMPGCFQGICGGLEDGETPTDGARREILEESGIDGDYPLYQLTTMSYIPDNVFSERARKVWGRDVVVVPMYFFAMPYDGEITLSHEHTEVRWLDYESAHELVYFHDQKNALYELNERLKRGNLY